MIKKYYLRIELLHINMNLFNTNKENKTDLTKNNIIKFYIANGNSTIYDLSQELNLSVPTTTKLVNEMCAEGYVREYGKLETSEGRHPNLYGVNPDSGYFVGVDISHSVVNLGLMDFKGDLVDLQMNVPCCFENTSEALDGLCRVVNEFIEQSSIDKQKILNVHFNIPGRVNPQTGYSYSVFNFSETPLTKVLSDKIGYPVNIDNDSRAMAYGEFMKGCVKGEKNVLFLNVSWGLGMGIVINGRLYNGKSGYAGEFGHVHLFENEVLCHCGKKGCLETEASASAFYRIVTERLKNGESSLLQDKSFTIDDVIDATNSEDVLCIDVVEEIGHKLGEALSALINIFNPELVVIGGSMALTGDYLLQPIKTAIRKYSLNLLIRDTCICLSKLKDKAGVIGACMLGRNRLFDK